MQFLTWVNKSDRACSDSASEVLGATIAVNFASMWQNLESLHCPSLLRLRWCEVQDATCNHPGYRSGGRICDLRCYDSIRLSEVSTPIPARGIVSTTQQAPPL